MKTAWIVALGIGSACGGGGATAESGSAAPPMTASAGSAARIDAGGAAPTSAGSATADASPATAGSAGVGSAGIDSAGAGSAAGGRATPSRAPARGGEAQVVARMDEEQARAFADLLAVDVANPNDAVLARRPSGADLGQQISQVREGGRTIAVGGVASGNGDVRVGPSRPPEAQSPPVRITFSSATTVPATSLTGTVVVAKITAAYQPGLKRCYKHALLADASLHGDLTLGFRVNETGRVTDATAKGLIADVSDCVAAQMTNWRFPIPKDKDAESTDTRIQLTATLQPE